MTEPIPALRRHRDPFKIMVLGAAAVYGVVGTLLFDKVATNSIRELPGPLGRIFLAVYGLAALVSLWGIFHRTRSGKLIERIGLWSVAGFGASFGLLSYFTVGLRGFAFVLLLLAISIAAVVRIWQIRMDANNTGSGTPPVTGEREG